MNEAVRIQRKLELIKRIASGRDSGDSTMNDIERQYTMKELYIRMMMGLLILVIGLYAALGLGLGHIFSSDEDVRHVSHFLVFIGLVFGQVGAGFVTLVGKKRSHIGEILFGLCFLVSAVVILIGMRNAFTMPSVGIYLILVGFVSAIISWLAIR